MNLPSGSLLSQSPSRTAARRAVLAAQGAGLAEADELLAYNSHSFHLDSDDGLRFPLPDEAFVEEWALYAKAVEAAGSFTAIFPWIPQLQFPIEAGLSQLPEYTAACRRGHFTYPAGKASGLPLEAPHLLEILLHPTPAGQIPVIVAGSRTDFESLIRAFTHHGEPHPVPASLGAKIIGGYNNFHRIHRLRDVFLEAGNSVSSWTQRFTEIKEQKALYQDRFIVLSPGPYSAVPAAALSLAEEQWASYSLAIRLEHECTHYFTKRVFGSMQNNLLDELMADYCGLDKAIGEYRAAWALHFFGLEAGSYRAGGRLGNYRGNPPLSSNAFAVLGSLVRSAIANLELLNTAAAESRGTMAHRAASTLAIAMFHLEELAAPQAHDELFERFKAWHQFVLESRIPVRNISEPVTGAFAGTNGATAELLSR